VIIPEIIDRIHELNFEERRISAKSIPEQLGISRERDMRKISANWFLKCPKTEYNRLRCQSSEQLLNFFRFEPIDFLSGAIGDH
jgi:hypothetical protein